MAATDMYQVPAAMAFNSFTGFVTSKADATALDGSGMTYALSAPTGGQVVEIQ
jgi:hypothetical protein